MITVKVSDLKSKIDELLKDGIEYVDLYIFESDPDYEIPKRLNFDAYDGEGGCVDYDDVEHIEVDAFYKLREYVNNRLSDVDMSLADKYIEDEEKEYLKGQKDELLAVKNFFFGGEK